MFEISSDSNFSSSSGSKSTAFRHKDCVFDCGLAGLVCESGVLYGCLWIGFCSWQRGISIEVGVSSKSFQACGKCCFCNPLPALPFAIEGSFVFVSKVSSKFFLQYGIVFHQTAKKLKVHFGGGEEVQLLRIECVVVFKWPQEQDVIGSRPLPALIDGQPNVLLENLMKHRLTVSRNMIPRRPTMEIISDESLAALVSFCPENDEVLGVLRKLVDILPGYESGFLRVIEDHQKQERINEIKTSKTKTPKKKKLVKAKRTPSAKATMSDVVGQVATTPTPPRRVRTDRKPTPKGKTLVFEEEEEDVVDGEFILQKRKFKKKKKKLAFVPTPEKEK